MHELGRLLWKTIDKFFGDSCPTMAAAVRTGAIGTALLFVLGKTLIGLYLGASDPGSAYGAAGSLMLVLIWVYYSSMIVLLGAEFTRVWAERHGRAVLPEKGAVAFVEEERRVREG